MKLPRKPLLVAAVLMAALAAGILALRKKPLDVEVAPVRIAPLEVSVQDLAETRSHDRYVVATPVAGRLLRVLLRDGDPVTAGEPVATLAPLPLTAREREEAVSGVQAAAASERSAQAQLNRAQQELSQARRDLARLQSIAPQGLAPIQTLEHARTSVASLQMEVAAARHRVIGAQAQLRGAQAALVAIQSLGAGNTGTLTVRAPASGHVLRVLEPSERVILSGTPVMTIGDLAHLEVVMEMLSTQAVRVSAGMPAEILDWGGDHPLRARVRRVEPYAFTKISALGVEEKRTNVILDFLDPPGPLGDGYRVEARIMLWRGAHVLQAPLSAIFRCAAGWCTYVLEHSHARLTAITIGQHNEDAVELLSGVSAGEQLIIHPPNELQPGDRVTVKR